MAEKAGSSGDVYHGARGTSLRSARFCQERAAVTDFPLTDEEKLQISGHLQELEIEHYDLDDVIRRLSADPAQDQLQLRRLKKRKLILKDQIRKLRARLIPDIIA
jgi:hypothetical protein